MPLTKYCICIALGLLVGSCQEVWGDLTLISEQSPLVASNWEMLPGVLQPVQMATLGSPVDGIIQAFHVHPGQVVQAGTPIATLDNRVAIAAMRVAEQAVKSDASHKVAAAQLAHADRHLQRVQRAFANKAASEVELDQATSSFEQSQLALLRVQDERKQLEAQFELAQARVAEHEIRAPFEGRIIRLAARIGESRVRAEEIAVIANVSQLQVDLQIPISLYGSLAEGQLHRLAVAAPINRSIEATVLYVEPQIDSATQTFRVRFVVENPNESLPYGVVCRLDSSDTTTSFTSSTDANDNRD